MRATSVWSLVAFLVLGVVTAGCSGGGGGGGGDDDDDDDAPALTSLAPLEGIPGTLITLTGERFGAEQGTSSVTIGSANAPPTSWSDTQIVVSLPATVFPGDRDVVVTTDAGASGPLPFEVTMLPAIYIDADASPNQIEAFVLDSAITPIAGSPWIFPGDGTSYGGYGGTIALHRSTRRLFSVSTTQITSWNIDAVDGVLSSAGSIALATDQVFGLSASDDGTRLVAAEYSANLFYAYSVAADGTLAPLTGSPVASVGDVSHTAITHDGAFAYAMDENAPALHAFSVGASVAEIAGSPFAAPDGVYDIKMAPGADRLYVAGYSTGQVVVFDVEPDGSLTENVARATVPNALSLCFDETGSRLFVVDGVTSLFVFDVAPNGALTGVAGSPFSLGGGFTAYEITCNRDGSQIAIQRDTIPEFRLFYVDAGGTPFEHPDSPMLLGGSGPTGFAFSE